LRLLAGLVNLPVLLLLLLRRRRHVSAVPLLVWLLVTLLLLLLLLRWHVRQLPLLVWLLVTLLLLLPPAVLQEVRLLGLLWSRVGGGGGELRWSGGAG
jgi:hypothetical protein